MSKKLSYKNALKRATEIMRDKQLVTRLIHDTKDTFQSKAKTSEKIQAVKFQLFTFIRLVRAYIKGYYREVSVKNMLYTVGVLIYFVTPTDIVPDFLPVGGFVDDAALIIWLYKQLGDEVKQFLEWESKHKQITSINE
ncbi:hypothetical protein GCM10011506_07960 [Marivirga lumbricoides]|uniref:DUF1232 domain-containing protein n=1 Tax=Marivirga lumbricoides TaxID=1046115 RepID=A0ABQ1LKD9_9BACT|nr:hypothetical protein GCM10011506_07960 [Marivirga lumbricoides]